MSKTEKNQIGIIESVTGEGIHFKNEQDWVSNIKIDPHLMKREQTEKIGDFGKNYMDSLFERY